MKLSDVGYYTLVKCAVYVCQQQVCDNVLYNIVFRATLLKQHTRLLQAALPAATSDLDSEW